MRVDLPGLPESGAGYFLPLLPAPLALGGVSGAKCAALGVLGRSERALVWRLLDGAWLLMGLCPQASLLVPGKGHEVQQPCGLPRGPSWA